ncbi:hypothetical protein CWC21_21575 [Pseudoalteromonas phenolica]|nr:hypothetical protein CWC21_21575 [Pseudoalteromonas phenolica]
MSDEPVYKRAFKYALIPSSMIILLVVFSMLSQEVVGSNLEIAFRFVVSCLGVFISMWALLTGYLFFNPDADKPSR